MEPLTVEQIDQDIASFIQQVGKHEEMMHQNMGAMKYAQAIKARIAKQIPEVPVTKTTKKERRK